MTGANEGLLFLNFFSKKFNYLLKISNIFFQNKSSSDLLYIIFHSMLYHVTLCCIMWYNVKLCNLVASPLPSLPPLHYIATCIEYCQAFQVFDYLLDSNFPYLKKKMKSIQIIVSTEIKFSIESYLNFFETGSLLNRLLWFIFLQQHWQITPVSHCFSAIIL